jgi:hypothetical protein
MMNKLKFKIVLGITVFILSSTVLNAQTTYGDSLSIQLEATVQASPARIAINWPADADASNFVVFRKLKSATSWGTTLATLSASVTQYLDTSVVVGVLYDYKILMNTSTALQKYGYLSSGIDVAANSNRGIALLVVENSFISNPDFQGAIGQLALDLETDGWFPKTIYVSKTDSVSHVKDQIMLKYNEAPEKTKMLILLGNVPVPYSGDINPDGHPDHKGAWPTDTYYADVDGIWVDDNINDLASSNIRNQNIPGDGKFDNSYIPSAVELQVGRIDLSDMPAFNSTEEHLLIKYLNKLHRYKSAQLNVQQKALIDDEFTTYPEGFSQNGYKNFSVLVGRNNIAKADYFSELSYSTSTTGSYLWSFGCGAGTYTSAGGIGATSTFASDSLSSVFTMLFGSYFGDWNYTDAFLRAPLAQGNTLTNVWAGRPNWHFYHMAMGENIGYSTQVTQNNLSTYVSNSTYTGLSNLVSINLMGDPSLRNTYIAPPTNLLITTTGSTTTLNWSAGGSEIGYNLYRRYADSSNFMKLNSTVITATTFTDTTLTVPGTVYYYVKAVEKKITPSGSFDNESLGLKGSIDENVGIKIHHFVGDYSVYPNPFTNALIVKGDNITKVDIYTLNGALIKSQTSSPANKLDLELNELSEGIYFMTILNSMGAVEHKKIIKIK